jgi:hypothetical protein
MKFFFDAIKAPKMWYINAINTPFTMGGFKEEYTSIQALAYKTNHILHKIHDEFQRAFEEEKTCECDYEVAPVQLFK